VLEPERVGVTADSKFARDGPAFELEQVSHELAKWQVLVLGAHDHEHGSSLDRIAFKSSDNNRPS
jgi:hypothetical protein